MRPTKHIVIPELTLPWPLQPMRWPIGSTILLHAPPGLGKSTIASLLHEIFLELARVDALQISGWISAEQIPAPIAALFRRQGRQSPYIWSVDHRRRLASAREALQTLSGPMGSFVVVDSLGPFGSTEAEIFQQEVITDCHLSGRRGIFIDQETKQGQHAGLNRLIHNPDGVLELDGDGHGNRMLINRKTRFEGQGLWVSYFRFDAGGRIVKPDWSDVACSIEGPAPSYRIVPYGRPGDGKRKLAGLLDALARAGCLDQFAGSACAAYATPATESGYREADDWPERKRMAEVHGQRWLTIPEALQAIAEAKRDSKGASRRRR